MINLKDFECRPTVVMLKIAHESGLKATRQPVQSYWPGLTPGKVIS